MSESAKKLPDNGPSDQHSEETYLSVPATSILHYPNSISDVFVRLPSDKMVRIAKKGEKIDQERIARFGTKDVQFFYVLKSDFGNLVTELIHGATDFARSNSTTDLKLERFFTVAQSVYSEILSLPISPEAFARTMILATEIGDKMREKPDFTKVIRTVVSLGDEFSRHSLGTVVIANMLMVQMGWTATKLIEPVTSGAFFHDIGLKEVPSDLRFKERLEMNQDEIKAWEAHVGIGVHLLNSLNFISPDVLRIVQEHHEIPNGTGFPNHLRFDRMFPMSKVVSFANMLANDIFDHPAKDGKAFSVENLVQKIDYVYLVMFGSELARAARRIFRKDDEQ